MTVAGQAKRAERTESTLGLIRGWKCNSSEDKLLYASSALQAHLCLSLHFKPTFVWPLRPGVSVARAVIVAVVCKIQRHAAHAHYIPACTILNTIISYIITSTERPECPQAQRHVTTHGFDGSTTPQPLYGFDGSTIPRPLYGFGGSTIPQPAYHLAEFKLADLPQTGR